MDKLKAHWSQVAGGWGAWREWTGRNFAPLTDWLRVAAWTPGTRVLDVGCGAGYPALPAAASVQPGGSVVAIDISPEMLAEAARGARSAGLANIEFLEMNGDDLRFGDGSFAAVTNTYGLMFSADPQRAVSEAFRVLQPGGRLAVVTWDEPAKSPYFTVIAGAASTLLGLPAPRAGEPGPFRLASTEDLTHLLKTAGFSEVRVESLSLTIECAGSDEYCQIFADLAWKSRMSALTDREWARFRETVAEAAQPYLSDGRLALIATSVCAWGRRP